MYVDTICDPLTVPGNDDHAEATLLTANQPLKCQGKACQTVPSARPNLNFAVSSGPPIRALDLDETGALAHLQAPFRSRQHILWKTRQLALWWRLSGIHNGSYDLVSHGTRPPFAPSPGLPGLPRPSRPCRPAGSRFPPLPSQNCPPKPPTSVCEPAHADGRGKGKLWAVLVGVRAGVLDPLKVVRYRLNNSLS